MAYEYSSESRRLDFPNPYRVENAFLVLTGAVFLAGGLFLLLKSRAALGSGMTLEALAPLAVSILLLALGVAPIAWAFSQLRFFFGRGQPANLAPELGPDQTSDKPGAHLQELDKLKRDLRGGQLELIEPKGALNGLLYRLIGNLIYAPTAVQFLAQQQFRTGISIVVLFASFLVAVVGARNAQNGEWIATFYLVLAVAVLYRSLRRGSHASAQIPRLGFVVLVVIAALAPVAIPYVARYLPDIAWLSPTALVFAFLIASLVAVALVFIALIRQCPAKPMTAVSSQQRSVNINTDPNQILTEFDREMQRTWAEKIPNRRYALARPNIDFNAKAGAFQAEVLEETQPLPPEDVRRVDLGAVFSLARYRWLALLDLWGTLTLAAACAALVWVGLSFSAASLDRSLIPYLTFGAGMLVLGWYCLRAAHDLWGRFDFVSDLIWIELNGNYVSARVDYGNTLTDRLKTERSIVNVEGMTLRVWCTRANSATFGKDTRRVLTGLTGLPDRAEYLAAHLADFATSQSMVVSPTAPVDVDKMGFMNQMNAFGNATSPGQAIGALLAQSSEADKRADAPSPGAGAFCTKCGAKLAAQAKFCQACGSAVA